MASNRKKSNNTGRSAAGGSGEQGGREVDVEVKNLLIDLVREHPAIYDKSHPDHFRVNLRNEIWDEIGKILDVPGNVCAKKWKDLVDTFRRKVDKSGSAGVSLSDKVLQWRFWDRMSFLKEYIVNRNTTSNCPPPRPPANQENQDAEQNVESNAAPPEEDEVSATRKRKTKSELAREEQFNKLLKIAEQEDHPVELALSALGKQIIRSLTTDEQDELLEDIRAVTDKYFREHRKRLRAEKAAATTSTTENALAPPAMPPPPLPPLTPAGQPLMNHGEILMDVTNMPPMQQFNAEYVHDVNGTTYLQM